MHDGGLGTINNVDVVVIADDGFDADFFCGHLVITAVAEFFVADGAGRPVENGHIGSVADAEAFPLSAYEELFVLVDVQFGIPGAESADGVDPRHEKVVDDVTKEIIFASFAAATDEMQLVIVEIEGAVIRLQFATADKAQFAFNFDVVAGGDVEFALVDELRELFDFGFAEELPIVVEQQEIGSIDAIQQGVTSGAEADVFGKANVADVGAWGRFEAIVTDEDFELGIIAAHAANQAVQIAGTLKGLDDGGGLREKPGAIEGGRILPRKRRSMVCLSPVLGCSSAKSW